MDRFGWVMLALACGCGAEAGDSADAQHPADAGRSDAFISGSHLDCPNRVELGCGPWFDHWFAKVFDRAELAFAARFVDVSGEYVLAARTGGAPDAVVLYPGSPDGWGDPELVEISGDEGADLVPVAIAHYENIDAFDLLVLMCEAGPPSERQCWIYRADGGELAPSHYLPLPTGVDLRGITFVDYSLHVYGDGVYYAVTDGWHAIVAPGGGMLAAAGGAGDWDSKTVFVGEGGRMLVQGPYSDTGHTTWQERDSGVSVDLRAVSVFGDAVVAGGDDGVIVVGNLSSSLASCAASDATITELLVAPWSRNFFMGVRDGELFGAAGDLICVKTPATPSPVVALSHSQDSTCMSMYAITADAVYNEVVNCTD